MDFDMLLASPRWEILQIIAEKPASPVELAEKIGTTVSYISQQMRLLEVAGLIKRERTGAVEKGKPRTLFSVADELAYFVLLAKGFSSKKLIKTQESHKNILRIWSVEDVSLHFYIERLYWRLCDSEEAEGIFIQVASPYKIIIASKSKKLKQDIENYLRKFDRKLDVSFVHNPIKCPEGFVSLEIQINKINQK